ncbi:ABC transporter ATP-binding protein [Nocardioides massiliensis]|uniref:Branched-chain amino acid transport system ATP-binding protein n=1 Tax=Nocardioides massiliensis TaxID=1325935 RepID=A0ABT9NJP4_9ACTN|nr:ABC transporter ATP-binding protein [Nocardioides massiliensis]MDP9820631.1 branched-chain amino acid transport system ATP-binding protein [Nocardioides massiliensis]
MALLEVDDVVVQFGGVTAVDHAVFAVEPGQITGLIGPNGAGKTTCFNVITGLQKPTKGHVRFDGKDITSLSVHRRSRRGMARTFQRLEAFGSLTVRENVKVALDIHRGLRGLVRRSSTDIDALLERVGVAAYAEERADSIPTGAARLLELARCLAGEPKLLLLDEPSSGLDESETDAFGALLKDLTREGKAVLMVEHDMDLVMGVCDDIHVLDFGKVIASGKPAEIRTNAAVQKAYLGYSDEDERPSEQTRTDLAPVGAGAAYADPYDEGATTVIPAVTAPIDQENR